MTKTIQLDTLTADRLMQIGLSTVMASMQPRDAGPSPNGAASELGKLWPGQGGVYAGLVRGEDGKPNYHLIVAAASEADTTCFKDLEFGSYGKEWYWSSTRYSAHYAWMQHFDNGSQGWDNEYNAYRVRAVRRVPA